MELNHLIADLNDISEGYAEKFGIDRTPEWHVMKLTEEVGELMQSYLKYAGQARTNGETSEELKVSLEDELADVIGMALLTASNQNIDIEAALKRKWLKHLDSPRCISD